MPLKSRKDMSLVVNARVDSSRIPRKLLRNFHGATLLDILLTKLEFLDLPKYVATCENEIIDIVSKYPYMSVIHRSEHSVKKGFRDQRITFAHYADIPTKYIMSINPCCPMVDVATIESAIEEFVSKSEYITMTSVKKLNNLFFDKDFQPLNVSRKSVSTLDNDPLYEMAHIFHIFDKEQFVSEGLFWDYTKNNPAFFVIKKDQAVDVDDALDFTVAENIYAEKCNNPGC